MNDIFSLNLNKVDAITLHSINSDEHVYGRCTHKIIVNFAGGKIITYLYDAEDKALAEYKRQSELHTLSQLKVVTIPDSRIRDTPKVSMWLAKNSDGCLYIYYQKPVAFENKFMTLNSNTSGHRTLVKPALFPNVTFENSPIEFIGDL